MDNVLTSVVKVSVRWNDVAVDDVVNGTQGWIYNHIPHILVYVLIVSYLYCLPRIPLSLDIVDTDRTLSVN